MLLSDLTAEDILRIKESGDEVLVIANYDGNRCCDRYGIITETHVKGCKDFPYNSSGDNTYLHIKILFRKEYGMINESWYVPINIVDYLGNSKSFIDI